MKAIVKSLLIAVSFAISIAAVAQTRKATKKPVKAKAKDMVLVEAYTQRTVMGVKGPAPQPEGTYIVVRWTARKYPETFFWRGKSGFFPCRVEKVRKLTAVEKKTMPQGLIYTGPEITNDSVKAGDTLLLTPLTRGKFAVPKEIPETAQNTVFYKVDGSNWLQLKVPAISKKANIMMP